MFDLFKKSRICKSLALTTFFYYVHLVESIKFSTAPICLNETSSSELTKIVCEDKATSLFISLVQYTNDYLNQCNHDDELNSSKLIINRCSAYPTQELASLCNGKQECLIKLAQPDFDYGFMGSNCKFRAKILAISYECIPNNFYDQNIPKYNICPGGLVDHPIHGFIHSPNYPKSHDSSQYCQLKLKLEDHIQRFEIFLIDLQLEDLSKRTYNPTDFLQINYKEKIFGEKKYMLIYNDTQDATLVFRSDLFFNKRGFLLYFQSVSKPEEEIDLFEETEALITTTIIIPTTKTTTTTTTTQTIQNLANDTNSTLLLNTTEKITIKEFKLNIKDINPKANHLSIENGISSKNYNEYTIRAIITLIGLIIILSTIIIFLLLTNKKRFFNSVMKYKQAEASFGPNNSRFYDASLVNGYLETNSVAGTNGSFILAHINQPVLPFSKNNPRLSDDSLKILLINQSLNHSLLEKTYTEKKSKTCEVYDEIGNDSNEKKSKNFSESKDVSKVNEYCYIQANGIVTGGPELKSNFVECLNQNFIDSKKSPPNSNLNSPLPSDCMVTSTPSIPKSLPPCLNKNDEESDYEKPSNVTSINIYKSCFEDEDQTANDTTQTLKAIDYSQDLSKTLVKEQEEDNYADNYQIPSNVLIK